MVNSELRIGNLLICFAFFLIFFLLFSIPNSSFAAVIIQAPKYVGLNSGLVGYWTFNGDDISNNTAYDRSGQANHGTLTNGPVRTIGKLGQALSFDSADFDEVDAGSATSLDELGPLSASLWMNSSNSDSSGRTLIGKDRTAGGFWDIRVQGTTKKITFEKDGTTNMIAQTADNIFSNNEWVYVVVTWDGSVTSANVHIYVNGVEAAYGSPTNGVSLTPDTLGNVSIGNSINSSPFGGKIDDVRLYNRALSADEIKRLYKIGSTFKIGQSISNDTLKKGLVGHWTFDGADVVNVTAYDKSGNGNNGTLTNGPVRGEGKLGQALNFDGSNDVVYISNESNFDFDSTDKFSGCGWFNSVSSLDDDVLLSKGSGVGAQWSLQKDFTDKKLKFLMVNSILSDNYFQVATPANSFAGYNIWRHVCYTYDGSVAPTGLKIYIDGASQTMSTLNNTLSGSILNNTNVKIISDAESPSFRGLADDVRIYNRVLSADEIKRLYKIGGTFKVNQTVTTDSLKKGLIGHWTFDGPDVVNTTAYDKSGQGNNGTLTNGPTRIQGKIGQALNFDNSNDYIDMGDLFYGDVLSVCAWVWAEAIQSNDSIVIKRNSSGITGSAGFNDWEFRLSGNKLFWGSWRESDDAVGVGATGNTALKVNEWYFVCGVQRGDGNSSTVYLNGIEDGSGTQDGAMNDSTSRIQIAARSNNTADRFWDGLIDDVRIYNRALTNAEVKRLYLNGR